MKDGIDECIDEHYQCTGKLPDEIRLSLDDYRKFNKEIADNFPMQDDPRLWEITTYRGIRVTWGVEMNWDI